MNIGSYLFGFALGCFLQIWTRRFALTHNFVDRPSRRKIHDEPVPFIGGVAIYFAFCVASMTLNVPMAPYKSFFALCAGIVFIGFLDDVQDISSREKMLWQVIIALLAVYWGKAVISDIGFAGALDTWKIGEWSSVLTVIAIVGFANALNMLDGMDGLAGSYSLVAMSFLAMVAIDIQNAPAAAVLLMLITVTFSFLLFNLRFPWNRRARIFLGDSGSMLLGFAIAWFSINLFQGGKSHYPPITALWILALPIWDTARLAIKRTLMGKNPCHGDRSHVHHILQDMGMPVNVVLLVLVSISGVTGLIGVAGHGYMPDHASFALFGGLFGAYAILLDVAEKAAPQEDARQSQPETTGDMNEPRKTPGLTSKK